MHKLSSNELDENLIKSWADQHICAISKNLEAFKTQQSITVESKLKKVLSAFSSEQVGTHHFSSVTGYGHDDTSREVIDKVFARVLGAEKAAVRLQCTSGTHAIALALFGILRPGDSLLSVTGQPYDTLEEVIGLKGEGSDHGSLIDLGVKYEELSLTSKGNVDLQQLHQALTIPRKMIFIQRSCGYSWRPSLSIHEIEQICKIVHNAQPQCVCFVDNCYGELVEEKEPTEVGADLIAGSLIKNLGGTIVPTGGYIAGKDSLVEKACCRLTAPGMGSKSGIGFDLYKTVLQGLFLSPQMISEALIGAELVANVFNSLGFAVNPRPGSKRTDLIQAIQLGNPKSQKVICNAFQACSPIGSYLQPSPAMMPGYSNDLVMAGGTFIDGSTSEFSADGPLRPPYILYVQGCTHHSHVIIALKRALVEMIKAGLLDLPKIH